MVSFPSHADVIVLKRRPGPALRPGDPVPERRALRAPGPGEVVVRNVVTSVDPYQLRMLRGSSEHQSVALGDPVPANSVGVVMASSDPDVSVGTQVATYTGWQTYTTTTIAHRPGRSGPRWAAGVDRRPRHSRRDGLPRAARHRPRPRRKHRARQRRHRSCRRRGRAACQGRARAGGRHRRWGGADTACAQEALGADIAFDYLAPGFPERLVQAAGEGIDLFFDNVGGRQLTFALSVLKDYGGVVLCGSVGKRVVRISEG